MIQARLTSLNKQEILYYLSYRGQHFDDSLDQQIQRCSQQILKTSKPKCTYRIFSKEEFSALGFEGEDVATLIQDSCSIILFGATIGNQVERLLRQKEVSNMSDAFIMDACGSCAIENVCDNFEVDMRQHFKEKALYVSSRYSPGYGDFPLSSQTKVCDLLHLSSQIGIYLSDTYIMTPRKSVTAIMGVSEKPFVLRKNGCEKCNLFMHCTYRKEGKTCE